MTKISIIGAGSAFTRDIAMDILLIQGLEGGTIALVDIDERRLELARRLVLKIVEMTGKRWEVIASTDRREVIGGSQFVINQIEVGGLETVRYEYEIPLKYGVNQCIGDTLGPGGLFKTLRTLPSWIEIVRDVEEPVSGRHNFELYQSDVRSYAADFPHHGFAGGRPLPLHPEHVRTAGGICRGSLRRNALESRGDQPHVLVRGADPCRERPVSRAAGKNQGPRACCGRIRSALTR